MSTSDARTPSSNSHSSNRFLADEAALKRVFDAEFTNALASAKSQLGEAGSLAPGVVETAFVNAWGQRDTLANETQFHAVLGDEIRHGAARALSRRHSGARFGAVGGQQAKAHAVSAEHETAAHVWSVVERALHGSGHTAEARQATAAAGRHDAAEHMKNMSKRPGWIIPVAIGVFALIISVAGVVYFDRLGEDEAMVGLVANQSIQPISSGTGQLGTTKLTDGTQMRIGPDTKVYVPDGFGTKNRAVRVEGTAEFDVAKGQILPFRVVARRQHFIATGTKFVISTFSTDTMAAMLVEDGTVTIKSGKNTAVANAGQAMLADPSKGITALSDDDKAERFGWATGHVAMKDKPLRDVVLAMGRWFNYDIKVPDTQLLDRKASFDVPLDSSKLAISQIEKSANLKFAYEGETRVFRDAGASPASTSTPKKSTPTPKKKK